MKKIEPPFLILFLLLNACIFGAFAQEHPPIPIQVEVNKEQDLNFGAFTVDQIGGSLSIDFNGNITHNTNVLPLNFKGNPTSALFDITANPGTLIRIQTPHVVTLNGSNGGTIELRIDSFSTGQVFITTAPPPAPNPVFVGGTLTIPANNIPGNYQGTFNLTFIHE